MVGGRFAFLSAFLLLCWFPVESQFTPTDINFVRQSVRRVIFDEHNNLPLATLNPKEIIGISSMFPATHYLNTHADIIIKSGKLLISSCNKTQTSIWFGGFNPYSTYTIDLDNSEGEGTYGFEFSNSEKTQQYRVLVDFYDDTIIDVRQQLVIDAKIVLDESISIDRKEKMTSKGKLIVQMSGSGLAIFNAGSNLPLPIAQTDFSRYIDLRKKEYLNSFHTSLYVQLKKGTISINKLLSVLSMGIGLADIRAITYEDGTPILDGGRLWYTMTIRGRGLPHQLQGVFSMNPTLFDLKFEGVILFDRHDGVLRNDIASHIFFDRRKKLWRGMTTGFSAYASSNEQKQLLAAESTKDPRFGFSIMQAASFGMIGDIEDAHILYDDRVRKWRILVCENVRGGYKAMMLESDTWDKNYERIAGPVSHNSTGTSIQWIDGKLYCFSGSDERKVFVYSYPYLNELGTLRMDLPPWDDQSGTRIWPNVVEMPEGYPFRFIALMMDRYNFPGFDGPNWSYGALYLYHGYLNE